VMLSMDLSLPAVFLIVGVPALFAGLTMFAFGHVRASAPRTAAVHA